MTESSTANSAGSGQLEVTSLLESSESLAALCRSIHAKIEAFLTTEAPTAILRAVQTQTRHSLRIIHRALREYPLSALSLSYNGGKDCLLLLILYLSALAQVPTTTAAASASATAAASPRPTTHLSAVYITPPHPFPEVEAFVARSAAAYRLSLARLQHSSMRAAFAEYLTSTAERPAGPVRAILVGTRRTDPHGGNLSEAGFQMTDGGWPKFMRVLPVLEWKYVEVWAFLRHLEIPYCELYDRGYTSLGGTDDTHPNPALKVHGAEEWRPAYELMDDEEERLGRDR